MPSLTQAFKEMRRHRLIAKRVCYCEHCGEKKMLEAAQQWREKQRKIRGFVHIGEWDPTPNLVQFRVPLHFGSVEGDTVVYQDPFCVPIGAVVVDCLEQKGIRFEWDEQPGQPILVIADSSLSGLPVSRHNHEILLSEGDRDFHTDLIPNSCFDRCASNPTRILNLTTLRRQNKVPPHLQGPVLHPQSGDHVKLGLLVRDAVAPEAHRECGDMIDRIQLESMWVEVTRVVCQCSKYIYCGELLSKPMFIDPAKLRIGSPLRFSPNHVYPNPKESLSRGRVRQ